jgi:hypothetical protein
LYQFTRRAIKLTVVIIVRYHCYHLRTEFKPIVHSSDTGEKVGVQ